MSFFFLFLSTDGGFSNETFWEVLPEDPDEAASEASNCSVTFWNVTLVATSLRRNHTYVLVSRTLSFGHRHIYRKKDCSRNVAP